MLIDCGGFFGCGCRDVMFADVADENRKCLRREQVAISYRLSSLYQCRSRALLSPSA
jgi:hypothetical protein